ASITTATVRLLGPGGVAVAQAAGSPALDGTGTVVTITPAASLANSTTYQIQVAGGASGAKDAAGNPLASTFQQATGFRTAAPPDTSAPTVTQSTPADGATNVAITVRPTVSFS